jgi:DNA-binding NarL/FixJ family response regulator
MSATSEVTPTGPFLARLIGSPGRRLDIFRQRLRGLGVVIVDTADPADVVRGQADLVVLVEPRPAHWSAVAGTDLPIVLVPREEADDADVVVSVLAGADAVIPWDTDAETVLAVMRQVSRGASVLRPAQMRAVAGLARAAGGKPRYRAPWPRARR